MMTRLVEIGSGWERLAYGRVKMRMNARRVMMTRLVEIGSGWESLAEGLAEVGIWARRNEDDCASCDDDEIGSRQQPRQ